jgi:hypothetical protein
MTSRDRERERERRLSQSAIERFDDGIALVSKNTAYGHPDE